MIPVRLTSKTHKGTETGPLLVRLLGHNEFHDNRSTIPPVFLLFRKLSPGGMISQAIWLSLSME